MKKGKRKGTCEKNLQSTEAEKGIPKIARTRGEGRWVEPYGREGIRSKGLYVGLLLGSVPRESINLAVPHVKKGPFVKKRANDQAEDVFSLTTSKKKKSKGKFSRRR